MKKIFLSAFLLVNGFLFTQAQTTIDTTFSHGGLIREYKIYIPASYDGSTAFPLVFNLHGRTSTADQQMLYTNFNAIADTANFILCYPQGTKEPITNVTFWNIGAVPGITVNDVDFIVKLIDVISSQYSINQNRVYACGMSNGGYLSYKLACESNKFAAIASVTGSMVVPYSCSTQPPIPIMQIHGTADPVVNYNGFAGSEKIEDLVTFWVNKNQCDATPVTTNIPDIAVDGTTTVHYLYQNGVNNHTVEFYKVENGGHTWPGATINIGVTSRDFNASKEIWRFFNTFTNSALNINDLTKIDFEVFPNPTADFFQINLSSEVEVATVSVFDITGKMHLQAQWQANKSFSINTLPTGVYFVKIQNGNHTGVEKLIIK